MTLSIASIATAVQSGHKTARQFVDEALDRAAADDSHALLSVTKERAQARADEIDAQQQAGTLTGKLAGVPFVVKDNFMAFGAPTTAASKMLESFMTPLQATAVERLEAEGAICIGKANLDAFAHGGSTENSYFGPTENAVDKSRVAGGSSGGSAVAVARGIVPFALGSDTGGSIRQPASFNGVVGMKPTYGTVSRYGVVAMASSTDTIGCFGQTVEEVEQVMSIMAGPDDNDPTALPDYLRTLPAVDVTPKKIGLISSFMGEAVDDDVKTAVNNYAEELRQLGHMVEEVEMPIAQYALAMYYIIVPAEVSSNLARYDGIRYGYRSSEPKSLAELYGKTRDEGFVTENKRRILIGSYVLSSGYFDAYYQKAQKARTLLIKEYDALFEEYDALLCPVAPTPAFKLGAINDDPIKMYLSDAMVVAPSLAGLPAISVPCTTAGPLPIGAQLIGQQRSDSLLYALAKQVQQKNEANNG